MDRSSALILCVLVFAIFGLLSYYGAKVKAWPSIVFSIFISLIILNIFYPPRNLATDEANFTLFIYAFIILFGIFLLGVYITISTLTTIRC
jgi:hypothetical protein